jgi:hypothetical protein
MVPQLGPLVACSACLHIAWRVLIKWGYEGSSYNWLPEVPRLESHLPLLGRQNDERCDLPFQHSIRELYWAKFKLARFSRLD